MNYIIIILSELTVLLGLHIASTQRQESDKNRTQLLTTTPHHYNIYTRQVQGAQNERGSRLKVLTNTLLSLSNDNSSQVQVAQNKAED